LSLYAQVNQSKIDSLESLLASKKDTALINLYIKLGGALFETNQIKAESYYNKALTALGKIDDPAFKAATQKKLGDQKISVSAYKEAYTLISQALDYYKEQKKSLEQSECYLSLSYINSRLANYPSALEQASTALLLARQASNVPGIGKAYNSLGNIYDNMGDHDAALKNYQKALEVYSSIKDKSGIARVYMNLSVVYNKTNKIEEAENLLHKAISIATEAKDDKLLSIAYGNMGLMCERKKDFRQALEYYELSLKMKEELGDRHSIMISHINVSNTQLQLGNIQKALDHVNTAITIGTALGAKKELIDAYGVQANIYEKKGDYRLAYRALQEKVSINDSLFSNDQISYLVDVEKRNEISQLERENQILRQNSVIDQLKLEHNRFIRYYLLIGLSFAIILIGLLIYQSSERRKNSRRLDEVNKQLIKTNKQLKKSEAELTESNRTKDQFFSIISHDLRNPLASMVSFVRIMKRDYESLDQEERISLIDEFEKIVNRTGNLLENLLMWSRSQTGRLNIKPTAFPARQILEENIDLHENALKSKNIQLLLKENLPEILVLADLNMMHTIIRNLLSNAVKFTPTGGRIDIGYEQKDKMCVYSVHDTGIGIDPEKGKTLFELGSTFVRTGTASEKGSGLGLVLCKDFVEKNNGNIWFESKPDEGTTFYFSVPLSSETTA